MKHNYQKFLDSLIEQNAKLGEKPSLLLHVCCAPCSSSCLEYLKGHFDITLLFYNPNISPKAEHDKRFNELIRFIKEKNRKGDGIKVLDVNYQPERFAEISKGLERESEGGKRCKKCFELRLEETAKICKEKNFDFFTTTLTISPYKDSELLNSIGKEMAEKYQIKYLFSDFKKHEGYKRSLELSREYELYRQEYCGCSHSKVDMERRRKENEQNN